MAMCSQIGSSATDKIDDHHGLCMNTFESTHAGLKALSVDEPSADVTEFPNIQDAIEDDSTSSTSHKSCNTLSSQDGITSGLSTHGDNIKSNDPSVTRSISLPIHLKPVSAMKGSREKRGAAPPVKLTVKWAPEVYDPIPTSVSHVVTNRSSSKHSKKNSKNKQKHGSKSSRGSKSKDKKQVRKRGGNSSSGSSYKLERQEQLVDFLEPEPQSGGIDFHVENPDRYCGSSFIKRYGTDLHLSSVAEAT
ncbi:hypothetical protein L1987_75616 [Smallanthus sonchifolius]|uniref:Uncharacterized protein n=1 Tax=Smallanthus sonchifolius TaxID=185202 RepID=A0ACB9A5Z1_9ASTR|nr:hypothetical protein L1987_75616 [Smallanthus sonchifolius]